MGSAKSYQNRSQLLVPLPIMRENVRPARCGATGISPIYLNFIFHISNIYPIRESTYIDRRYILSYQIISTGTVGMTTSKRKRPMME